MKYLVFAMLICCYIWVIVQIAAGEPFDALVLLGVTMYADAMWLEDIERKANS